MSATSIRQLPKEFWHFVSAKLSFTLGIRMVTTIVIYQVFHLSNTFTVGMAGLAEFVPAVITAIYAGHYIDTHDKRTILLSSYALYALCAIFLAVVSSSWFSFSNDSLIKFILGTVFLTGVIRSFSGPAANAMIAAIVPRDQLQTAITFNSSAYLIASVTGHATGGLLIALVGISSSYFVATSLIVLSLSFGYFIKPKPPTPVTIKESKIKSIQGGFKYVWNNKTLLSVISLDLFAVFFGGAVAFIPEIAETVLHAGPMGYGFLNAAMDLGALCSVGLLIAMPMRRKQGMKMMLAIAGFGICIIAFGLSKVYWLSFASLAIAGFLDGVSVVVRGTITQLQTPDELRGRVSSINMIFINSSNELGQFESGITSRLFGTVNAIVIGGAMSILIVAGTWVGFPKLKKLEY